MLAHRLQRRPSVEPALGPGSACRVHSFFLGVGKIAVFFHLFLTLLNVFDQFTTMSIPFIFVSSGNFSEYTEEFLVVRQFFVHIRTHFQNNCQHISLISHVPWRKKGEMIKILTRAIRDNGYRNVMDCLITRCPSRLK